ncbi:MAG: hypothetical protein IJA15_02310 [Clostridia bacterium]|nr:hypothetical protein [Clostridia bacterium]
MVSRSKVETFLGFAIKSRALSMGTNTIATVKKAFLIIVCDSASEGTKKIALSYAKKFSCPLMVSKKLLEDITLKENCKVVAVTDKNLAKAIIENQDENFSISSGGNGL